jgi:hypothetical protein
MKKKLQAVLGSGAALAFLFAGAGTLAHPAVPRAALAANIHPAGPWPCCR